MERVFGKYVMMDKIATGGMAEIWLAKEQGLAGFERVVVIKKILAHYSDDQKFISMFLDEAKLAAKLSHSNVVQILDFGKEQDSYYIAMEFISGADLEKIANKAYEKGKKIPIPFVCEVVAQAAEGLHYAHTLHDMYGNDLHIVHRDISPQNIIVTYGGKTKILDFGIAKAKSHSNKTRTGVIKGKLAYMSPEQIYGKTLDGRSDVFALGILLYELTLQKRLFKADSDLRVLKLITEERIIPPKEIDPTYPEMLSDIIMKALERDRENRYQSGEELKLDLEYFLKKEAKSSSINVIMSKWLKELFYDEIVEFKNRVIEIEKILIEEAKEKGENISEKDAGFSNFINYMGDLITSSVDGKTKPDSSNQEGKTVILNDDDEDDEEFLRKSSQWSDVKLLANKYQDDDDLFKDYDKFKKTGAIDFKKIKELKEKEELKKGREVIKYRSNPFLKISLMATIIIILLSLAAVYLDIVIINLEEVKPKIIERVKIQEKLIEPKPRMGVNIKLDNATDVLPIVRADMLMNQPFLSVFSLNKDKKIISSKSLKGNLSKDSFEIINIISDLVSTDTKYIVFSQNCLKESLEKGLIYKEELFKMIQELKKFNIIILDYIIFDNKGYFSLKEKNIFQQLDLQFNKKYKNKTKKSEIDDIPNEKLNKYQQEGNKYFKEKNYKKALIEYKRGLKLSKNKETYYAIGWTFYHLKNYKSAIKHFKKGVGKNFYEPYRGIGYSYIKLGKFKDGKEYLDIYLSRVPKSLYKAEIMEMIKKK